MKGKISDKTLRNFGILIGLGFPIIFGYIIPLISQHNFRFWTLYFGLPFLILGILEPIILLYPYKAWIKFGLALGWINSRIILFLIFIFILLPIALLLKLFGYDPLKKELNNKNSWRENREDNNIDLKKIF